MPRPTLKQFNDLSPLDFERHPVWIACHSADCDEPWHDDTDEETFRPYVDPVPAGPTGEFLVSATATTSDGATYPGFLTPAENTALGMLQPHMFVGNCAYGFWGGMVGISADVRREFLDACGKSESNVFPIRFAADPALSAGVTDAEVVGWL